MDLLGRVFRDFERQRNAAHVKTAYALAKDFFSSGMNRDQVEEMLFSSNYSEEVIKETLDMLPNKK